MRDVYMDAIQPPAQRVQASVLEQNAYAAEHHFSSNHITVTYSERRFIVDCSRQGGDPPEVGIHSAVDFVLLYGILRTAVAVTSVKRCACLM